MRQYEISVILDPDLEKDGVSDLTDKIGGWITDLGGTVQHTDQTDKRHLAYSVRKKQEGYYAFFYATLPADGSHELERNLRHTEDVLRFMVITNNSPPSAKLEPLEDHSEKEGSAEEAPDADYDDGESKE